MGSMGMLLSMALVEKGNERTIRESRVTPTAQLPLNLTASRGKRLCQAAALHPQWACTTVQVMHGVVLTLHAEVRLQNMRGLIENDSPSKPKATQVCFPRDAQGGREVGPKRTATTLLMRQLSYHTGTHQQSAVHPAVLHDHTTTTSHYLS